MSWDMIRRVTTGPTFSDENHSVTVTMEEYPEGAWGLPEYRVGATHTLSGKAHTRKRTFAGETAHMDAERLFNDIFYEVRFKR